MASRITATLARQGEHIKHPALGCLLRQVGRGADETERGSRIARIEIAGDDCAGPATDAGQHRYVLASIGTAIAHRLADDSRAGPELPLELARRRIERLERAVERAVENQVAGRRERAAPQRQI